MSISDARWELLDGFDLSDLPRGVIKTRRVLGIGDRLVLPVPPQLVFKDDDLHETNRYLAAASIRAAHTRLSSDNNGNTIVVGAASALVGALIAAAFGDGYLTNGPMTWAALVLIVFLLVLVTITKPLRKQIANLKELSALWEEATDSTKGQCAQRYPTNIDTRHYGGSWLVFQVLLLAMGAVLLAVASLPIQGWERTGDYIAALMGGILLGCGLLIYRWEPSWRVPAMVVGVVGVVCLIGSVVAQIRDSDLKPAIAGLTLLVAVTAAALIDGFRWVSLIPLGVAVCYAIPIWGVHVVWDLVWRGVFATIILGCLVLGVGLAVFACRNMVRALRRWKVSTR